jgi:ribose 5-phosphate isomerase B
MKIAIGCDHAGFPYKDAIRQLLESQGHQVTDFGTDSTDSVDYPDFVHPVAQAIEDQKATFGVLICGSGNGVAITANKHQKIRAAVCWNTDLAALARQHNDANVVCLPARFIPKKTALDIVNAFMTAEFEGGRHARRVSKISVC